MPIPMGSRVHAALAVLIVTSCAGGTKGLRNRGDGPPPYASHDAELFDDAIEPSALGEAGEATLKPARSDMALRERTQVSDATLRARIVTVTVRDENTGRSWLLGLQSLGVLTGQRPPGSEFTVEVDPTNPAAGILRAMEARLVGMTFVAFIREYAVQSTEGAVGEGTRWHFHLARDDKSEIAAVREAAALGEVR